MKPVVNFFKDQEGASIVEYALLVLLIALVAATGITTLGGNLNTLYGNAAAQFSGS
jgi:pilus assembly protein Flp/PilA